MDGNAQDSRCQQAAGWYARLRAPERSAEERAEFQAWRASDPQNAAAYVAAERMNDALARLAMVDPRLRAMIDRAARAHATLPDDPVDDDPGCKLRPTTTRDDGFCARHRAHRPVARGCAGRGRGTPHV